MIDQTINVRGHATRYLESGESDAPPLVLLHDGAWGGSSSVTWSNSIEALALHFHVFVPDLLGFGGTDKVVYFDRSTYEPRIEHIEGFVEAAKIVGPVHLVGNSFGGSLALRLLASGPHFAIRSLTSINGTGGPWRTPIAYDELGHWDGTESDLERIVAHLVEPFEGWDDHVRERLRWASVPGHYRSVASVSLPLPPDLREVRSPDEWPTQLAGSVTPVLLVAGSRDTLLERDWPTHLEAVLGDCTTVVLDSKHEPNIDRPDLLVPILIDFLLRKPLTTE